MHTPRGYEPNRGYHTQQEGESNLQRIAQGLGKIDVVNMDNIDKLLDLDD